METVLSVCLGVGLAAACGFRVFVPMLVLSAAVHAELVELGSSFQWLGSTTALVVFAVATVLEIAAYYIPWVDNALDTIAGPTAVVAGVVVTASVVTDMDPVLKWALAVIAGGGAAAAVQGLTSVVRGASSLTTGGLGNPVVSTAEAAGSAFFSVLAVFVPMVAVVLLALFLVVAGRRVRALRVRRRMARAGGS